MLSGDGCLHSKGCAFCLALAPEQLQPLCSSLSHPYCPGGQVQPVPPIPNPLLLLLLTPIPTHPRHRSHTQKAPMQKKKKKNAMECIYLQTIACLDGKSVFYTSHVDAITVFQNTQRYSVC